MQQALERLLRWHSTRIAMGFIALLTLVAIYAPFVVSDQALFWRDENGWRLPLLVDLFNTRDYPHWYELIFNLLGIELPLLLVATWLLRRRFRLLRACAIALGLFLVSYILCLLPMFRLSDGSHGAIWRDRPIDASLGSYLDDQEDHPQHMPTACFTAVPHRADSTYTSSILKPPGAVDPDTHTRFWLGTDSNGHDVLARLVFGTRISLTIGFVATGVSLLIGTLIGAISGYFGGWLDVLLQRLVEIMLCFPTFLLILIIMAVVKRDIFVIMFVIGLTSWAGTARLVRGEFLAQSVRDYVLAGESIGVPRWQLMFRHILPNALTPLLITATFGIAGAVISESTLSFLGLGDGSVATWGSLLEQGRENIDYGWLIYAPGLAVFALVSSLNILGNGLQEALDPKAVS